MRGADGRIDLPSAPRAHSLQGGPHVSNTFASPPLHLLLLAALGLLLGLVTLTLTVRALAADRRAPWRWAQRHGGRVIALSLRVLRYLGIRAAAAIAASAAALVLFASVAEDVTDYPTVEFDERVRTVVQAHRTPALDQFFHTITWLGATSVLTVLVVATALLLAWRRSRRSALLAVLGPLVASFVILAAKHLFRRDRPEGALALDIHTYSFPSGHSTGSAASLLTIAYVLAREEMVPWWSVPVAALLVFLVGFSRVYLDAHWATDVAGGWAVGAGLALAGVALYEKLREADRAHRMAEGEPPDAPAKLDEAEQA